MGDLSSFLIGLVVGAIATALVTTEVGRETVRTAAAVGSAQYRRALQLVRERYGS
jgi:hypothetical protein